MGEREPSRVVLLSPCYYINDTKYLPALEACGYCKSQVGQRKISSPSLGNKNSKQEAWVDPIACVDCFYDYVEGLKPTPEVVIVQVGRDFRRNVKLEQLVILCQERSIGIVLDATGLSMNSNGSYMSKDVWLVNKIQERRSKDFSGMAVVGSYYELESAIRKVRDAVKK